MANPTDRPVIINPQTIGQGVGEPGQTRTEPLLDSVRLKMEYLFGIPLRAPLTGEVIDDDTLKSFIRKGIAEIEDRVGIPVSPTTIYDKFDYERADDTQFGTRKLSRHPVMEVLSLEALWPGRREGQEVLYPTDWVDVMGHTGLVRIVPRSGTEVAQDVNFVTSFGYQAAALYGIKSFPSYWRIKYIAGFPDDKVPVAVNDAIGLAAAAKLLALLGPILFPYGSFSAGIDGVSQAHTTPGPMWLQARIADINAQLDKKIDELKSYYGTDIALWSF